MIPVPVVSAVAEPSRVRGFLVQALVWNVALFGLIRIAWVDTHLISALVVFQESIVRWYAGAPHVGLVVASNCSGADIIALCMGVTLAYPVAWGRRVTGALAGAALLLTLNTIRIATLYAAPTPAALVRLHEYVWPVLLTVVTVLWVALWIRRSDRARAEASPVTRRLVRAVPVSLVAYAAAVPWVFTSASMLRLSEWTASAGAAVLRSLGATVHTAGPILTTSRGSFQVTPECLFTPVLPLFLAAIWSVSMPRGRRAAWLAAALPLFFALGVARVLVLALPPLVSGEPVFLAHGFYQFLTSGVLIAGAAHIALRHASGREASIRTILALAAALGAVLTVGPVWQAGLLALARGVQHAVPATLVALSQPGEQQGALALLPITQLGLIVGLWIASTGGRRRARFAAALAGLGALQILLLVAAGLWSARSGAQPHALAIRACAVGLPLALSLVWRSKDGTLIGDPVYRRFWHQVGETFPSLTGAASTDYYFENEKRLLTDALPPLAGLTLLKTDLWDEAKNTRILQWAAGQGARVFGIDISAPIVDEARAAFGARPLQAAVTDVRRLPFADASFDAVYSMGTIEHFAETEATVVEIARVLKPGGRLLLGVPNRHDPFLRPALVWVLSRLGLYAYGLEKSYTRRQLRGMLEDAGLDVGLESGILFVPGWLRLLDLWCYTRVRPLSAATGVLLRPFVWLDRRYPTLRRHGYLLASVGVKTTPGMEYIVDARGCDPARLRSLPDLQRLFADIIGGLNLRPVSSPVWHVFPGPGGITGVVLLAESHLTIHTFPETGVATINLYCCRRSAAWDWASHVRDVLGAGAATVRVLRRS